MDDTLKCTASSSPEPRNPGTLYQACLFGDGDLPFDDKSTPPLVLVPETPSPRNLRHMRRCRMAVENHRRASIPSPPLNGEEHSSMRDPRKFKRRKLSETATSTLPGGDPMRSTLCHTSGFSSSLSHVDNISPSNLLEPPLPTQPSLLSSFSSSRVSRKVIPNGRLWFDTQTSVIDSTVGPSLGGLKKRTSQRAASSKSSSKSSTSLSNGSNVDCLSFLTREEKKWLKTESKITHPAVVHKILQCDEFVISDEESDTIQAVVRAQMEEDEAFAHSLQTQFDIEQQQEHQAQEATSNNNLRNCLYDRRRGERVLQRSHRRNGHFSIATELDDSQGNDYEALLAFEEHQGAVVTNKIMTKREIERLPTRSYVSLHNAGKTQCQICFSDYSEGEPLRILPCLHDYHVQCIDRWLTKNVTCPICRADISECTAYVDPV